MVASQGLRCKVCAGHELFLSGPDSESWNTQQKEVNAVGARVCVYLWNVACARIGREGTTRAMLEMDSARSSRSRRCTLI